MRPHTRGPLMLPSWATPMAERSAAGRLQRGAHVEGGRSGKALQFEALSMNARRCLLLAFAGTTALDGASSLSWLVERSLTGGAFRADGPRQVR